LLTIVVMTYVASACAADPGVGEYACGPIALPGPSGPFDYRITSSEIRQKLEATSTGTFGGNVDYMLRMLPNDPRVLLGVSRYSLQRHIEHLPGARYSNECYFERAIRFQPDDPMPHVMYAIYLRDRKRMSEVRPQLDEAERLRGEQSDFDLDYNLGLLYFDIGAYDQALVAAKRAYALGAQMPGLQRKLQAAGKWKDDPVPPPPPVDAVKADAEVKGDVKTDVKTEADAPAR
jgi:hypothetical protein